MINLRLHIESRESDELIIISKSTSEEYQPEAIELAKKELVNRKFTQEDIDHRYIDLSREQEKHIEQTISQMAVEDYGVFEKILIILFWPKELFDGWYLRGDGYQTKAKNRIKLILMGIALYAVAILLS